MCKQPSVSYQNHGTSKQNHEPWFGHMHLLKPNKANTIQQTRTRTKHRDTYYIEYCEP